LCASVDPLLIFSHYKGNVDAFSAHFQAVEWYGRGPHECYPDRKASAWVGRYKSTAKDMHVPYISPGECGGRSDVRWVAVTDLDSGKGFVAAPGGITRPLQMNVSEFSTDALEQAFHTEELVPDEQGIHVSVRRLFDRPESMMGVFAFVLFLRPMCEFPQVANLQIKQKWGPE
jgi:hypothetical protein